MDRLRKVQLDAGRFHFHIDVLGIIAIIALAMNVWAFTRISYSIKTEREDRMSSVEANIKARFDDCENANDSRKALNKKLHVKLGLKNCKVYADRALPEGEQH
jgi:hypothetical protein